MTLIKCRLISYNCLFLCLDFQIMGIRGVLLSFMDWDACINSFALEGRPYDILAYIR